MNFLKCSFFKMSRKYFTKMRESKHVSLISLFKLKLNILLTHYIFADFDWL